MNFYNELELKRRIFFQLAIYAYYTIKKFTLISKFQIFIYFGCLFSR